MKPIAKGAVILSICAVDFVVLSLFLPTFTENALANFFGTVFGAVVGIPLALWLSHRGLDEEERRRRTEEGAILRSALEVILDALRKNEVRYGQLKKHAEGRNKIVDLCLNETAFPAVDRELSGLLKDASLHSRLAVHFFKIRSLRRFHELDVAMSSDAKSVRTELGNLIPQRVEGLTLELSGETSALIRDTSARMPQPLILEPAAEHGP